MSKASASPTALTTRRSCVPSYSQAPLPASQPPDEPRTWPSPPVLLAAPRSWQSPTTPAPSSTTSPNPSPAGKTCAPARSPHGRPGRGREIDVRLGQLPVHFFPTAGMACLGGGRLCISYVVQHAGARMPVQGPAPGPDGVCK